MKKVLILAAFATIISIPAFAQSFDPDAGTGNLAPPVAYMGSAGAYAQAPGIYERGYVREPMSRGTHRYTYPDRDNTSVPGQSVNKDDTEPMWR
ncbi:MAG: hypothetical protein WCF39_19935 [Pseudolabrys sp.]